MAFGVDSRLNIFINAFGSYKILIFYKHMSESSFVESWYVRFVWNLMKINTCKLQYDVFSPSPKVKVSFELSLWWKRSNWVKIIVLKTLHITICRSIMGSQMTRIKNLKVNNLRVSYLLLPTKWITVLLKKKNVGLIRSKKKFLNCMTQTVSYYCTIYDVVCLFMRLIKRFEKKSPMLNFWKHWPEKV